MAPHSASIGSETFSAHQLHDIHTPLLRVQKKEHTQKLAPFCLSLQASMPFSAFSLNLPAWCLDWCLGRVEVIDFGTPPTNEVQHWSLLCWLKELITLSFRPRTCFLLACLVFVCLLLFAAAVPWSSSPACLCAFSIHFSTPIQSNRGTQTSKAEDGTGRVEPALPQFLPCYCASRCT